MDEYLGSCLCGITTYKSRSAPLNPHLCSCTMCQKSSGALTVAWLEFILKDFEWGEKSELGLYKSSEKTQRCFCKKCGSFLGAINQDCDTISITIGSLVYPNEVIPGEQHSYKTSAPSWWEVHIKNE